MSGTAGLCDDAAIEKLLAIADDSDAGVREVDRLLAAHPEDPRLHFLKGSLLIGLARHLEAHAAMSRALEIAPGYDIARFQLGFFELTSGEAEAALATWGRLGLLPEGHYLRLFVEGLQHLIADRFSECISSLGSGITLNLENLPLNRDMELIIGQCQTIMSGQHEAETSVSGADVSATSLLLGGFGTPGRKH
jgi:tetratricopeptide (TPR) repeat protein